ncbi:organic hydroperoxide resistance protein [Petropleomorpha daqingensis]|uniref:Ohr subfamily peroxiredoxin n=1 Tax=Petropleomorpha daqingensis TaxID=2026353 RepID=A0A853CJM0_9ACTN|nr:organic hydroperoxide resistance protein [Petropleomorpha daqingensis]NYJ06183.1 Ohr subfamily peroxiredoxin [Petropleomorpha daqingensis]
MQRLYTAEATAYGARTGAVVTSDEKLDLELSRPAGMGGDDGPGTNPEQLFAAGYAACFHSAMRHAVREMGLSPRALDGSHVTARVHFLKEPPIDFGLAVELELTAPGLDADQALTAMELTHQICPYSKATMGNIEVDLQVAEAAPVD